MTGLHAKWSEETTERCRRATRVPERSESIQEPQGTPKGTQQVTERSTVECVVGRTNVACLSEFGRGNDLAAESEG